MKNGILLENISREELLSEIENLLNKAINERLAKEGAPKQYLSKKEVAERLGISFPTINRLERSGRLVGYRIGRRVLFKPEEVDSALNQRRHGN